ncbi:FadR/GntR family transcriptional regulator [Pseudonocardia humida]|uniref:FadR family transcriptional regulator n=1 Tax=Pseudonocardia humida TaxID=2800819 RepID=A0ABT0ZSX3_9PSEU|nr:FadR/GntR family transcriptional regulator [Pseudonocardia humida]MCO1653789.1 FadR family transcriptional regulator [Pseudonocardia humida]
MSRPRRADALVAALLAEMREGVVRPGAKLPTESELAARHGVSRTVVREAITQLQTAGIVRTHQGRGSFVLAPPDSGEFRVETGGGDDRTGLGEARELLEFRTAVEVEAAGLAALRRTPEQLAAIADALAELSAGARHPARAVDADYAFHLAVAHAAGNRHFPALLGSLGRGMLAIPHERLAASAERIAVVHAEHSAVHAAVAAGDPLAAGAAMRTHLANSARRLQSS